MKLDNREKYQKLRKFITELKSKKSIDPFLDLQDIPKFGIYDFWYINKNPPSFAKIEKKIKDSKYDQLGQFIEDLKQIFISVADYALIDDPIQKVCEELREEVDKFGQAFLEEFKITIEQKVVKPPKPAPAPVVKQKIKVEVKEQPVIAPPVPRPQPHPFEDILYRQRASTLSEKLQMLFLLRANQNNEPYLRSIGAHYGIGMEIQDQYVLTINDKNKQWLQFIDKNE